MADDATTTPKITIADGGPYVIEGGPQLTKRWPAKTPEGEPMEWNPVGGGEDFPARERFALCRCGQSGNKPYCDGTHQRTGFDGTLTADRAASAGRREVMAGDGIVLTDDTTLCANAGFCGTASTSVWDMIGATANGEVRTQLKRMASMCPSGRLQFSLEAGGDPVEPGYDPSIAAITDGPLWVRGGIPLQAGDGFTYEVRNRMTLCRCGSSANKPFCDGAHETVGFSAP